MGSHIGQEIPNSAFADEASIPSETVNAPTDIVATALSYDQIELTWTDNSDNEIYFQVFRASEDDLNYQPVALVKPDSTSYIDTELEPETRYYYSVVALGQYGESETVGSEISSTYNLLLDGNADDNSGNNVSTTVSGSVNYDESRKIQGSSSISFAGSGYLNLDGGNQFIHTGFTQRSVAFWMYTEDNTGIQDIFDEGRIY